MKKDILTSIIIFIVALAVLSWLTAASIIGFDLAAFLAFIAVLGILIFYDRKKVKLDGIIIIRRTKRGKKFLDNVAKNRPVFWSRMAKIGIVVGVLGLIIGTAFLSFQAFDIAAGGKEGGVKLLLPGPVSEPVNAPGVLLMPWWIWVIGIAAVIIPHEGFHGIMCRLEKIRISSVGWLLFFIIPGAFVEPDEKQLQKSKRITKLKVYAAGSFANILVALIVILILAASFMFMFSNNGVYIEDRGMVVFDIDGTPINNRDDFINVLSTYEINDTIPATIGTRGYLIPKFNLIGNLLIPEPVVTSDPSKAILNNMTLSREPDSIPTLQVVSGMPDAALPPIREFSLILLWIYIFSLGVGIVNLLPIKPLDGGLIFEEITSKFTKRAKKITKIVSIIVLLILIFNLIGPIFV